MRALLFLAFALLFSSAAPAAFDHEHRAWTELLKRHVLVIDGGKASKVRYAGFARDRATLKAYLDSLSQVSPQDYAGWNKAQRLAFLINAYNAYTVEKVLTALPGSRVDTGLRQFRRQPVEGPLLHPARQGAKPGRHRARDDPRPRGLRRSAHSLRGELCLDRLSDAARGSVRPPASTVSSMSRRCAFSPIAHAIATIRPAADWRCPASSTGTARTSPAAGRGSPRSTSSSPATPTSSRTHPTQQHAIREQQARLEVP